MSRSRTLQRVHNVESDQLLWNCKALSCSIFPLNNSLHPRLSHPPALSLHLCVRETLGFVHGFISSVLYFKIWYSAQCCRERERLGGRFLKGETVIMHRNMGLHYPPMKSCNDYGLLFVSRFLMFFTCGSLWKC